MYFLSMFAITGFYHRYFSHKTYTLNRFWQFIFGALGSAVAQHGPIWWASHHRTHHQTTDTKDDPHSPVAHLFGKQRYKTNDHSKNNFFLALITLGEGWHNNHHHYPASTRQGFFTWEIDITYYVLRLLQAIGIVKNIREVPSKYKSDNRLY
jgi:fatty-acid desaturase